MRRYCKAAPRYEDLKHFRRRAKWIPTRELTLSAQRNQGGIKQNPEHPLNGPFATD